MACLTQTQPAAWSAALYSAAPLRASSSWNSYPVATPSAKPRLRLPLPAPSELPLPSRRFDPFADDDEPQNTPPPPRGRPLTPLTISVVVSTTQERPTGRRRAPSFSAGTPRPTASLAALANASVSPSSTLSSYTSYSYCSGPASGSSSAPPPSASRVLAAQRITTQELAPAPTPAPAPVVAQAPTPFHARHYPTSDARARLLARTLLNRIHAVGRPRSTMPSTSSGSSCRVPSRLSECVVAC
ncbi:hypothetical protein FB45DRAFT_940097 [Roridomyces roridus]|uniref:Uncharacterized protein n=1 Tax=Roridomyces roridus TaxID=1738132 RepID=A0AAD7B7H5_9AGAR|nr:hypothetical protein FB45DRAFT_940097 [Roridomyces roridus]